MTTRLASRVFFQAQPKRMKMIIPEWKTKKNLSRKPYIRYLYYVNSAFPKIHLPAAR